MLHSNAETLSKELAGGCPFVFRNELRSFAALERRSRFREAITTQQPSNDSSLVMAFPIPVPPPVTIATLLRKRSLRNTLHMDISRFCEIVNNYKSYVYKVLNCCHIWKYGENPYCSSRVIYLQSYLVLK